MSLFFKKKHKEIQFTPDFNRTRYDNYLDYVGSGGDPKEWGMLCLRTGWEFEGDKDLSRWEEYQRKIGPINTEYYGYLIEIRSDWSVMYNLGDFCGERAIKFADKCTRSIQLYKKMCQVDSEFGEKTPVNVPAYTRLAMLFEKQGDYEASIDVCKDAVSNGVNEKARLARMIKKSGRKPTSEELALLD